MDEEIVNNMTQTMNHIYDFIIEKLNGKIDNLKTFNMLNLENDKQYGCPGRNFDPDDTEIVSSIFYFIYRDDLPDLYRNQIGTNKHYRGDTLNTFNTLLGENYEGINLHCPNDIDLYNSVISFKNRCYRIGNFSLLPNLVPPEYTNRDTINCYRGFKWKDYYDQFLVEIKKYYEWKESTKEEVDLKLRKLCDFNDIYFQKYKTIEMFININILNPYVDNHGNIKSDLFEPRLAYWETSSSQEYESFIKKYMLIVDDIIDHRSEIIIQKIKEQVEKYYKQGILAINEKYRSIEKLELSDNNKKEKRRDYSSYIESLFRLAEILN